MYSAALSPYVDVRRRTSTYVARRRTSKLKPLTYVDVRYVNGPLSYFFSLKIIPLSQSRSEF